MSYFTQAKLVKSLYAWILLLVSAFIGGFIGSFMNIDVDLFGMIISGGLLAAIMSISANFLIVFLIDLVIFWWLHNKFVGSISFLQALLVFILPSIVAGFIVSWIGELGSVFGLIMNFLVFHFIYHFIKTEV